MKTFFSIISILIGAVYYAILYIPGFIIQVLARLLLSLAYCLMLDWAYAKGVFKSVFKLRGNY